MQELCAHMGHGAASIRMVLVCQCSMSFVQVLELSSNCTPEMSDYKVCVPVNF